MEFLRENPLIIILVLVIVVLIAILTWYIVRQRSIRRMSYSGLRMGVNPMYEKPRPSNYVPRSHTMNKEYFNLSEQENFLTLIKNFLKKSK